MERVCRACFDKTGVKAAPAYMYALTREKRLPPMGLVRKSIYSLLEPQKRISNECNILGFFSALEDNNELYALLKSAGIKKIHEIGRCKTFEDYKQLSRANFSIVLNSEARAAAQDMEERLGIPFIELTRMYRLDKIHNQYRLLGEAIGAKLDDSEYFDKTKALIESFKVKHGEVTFAVGESLNADSFELALALTEYGFKVREIFGTVGERNFVFVKKLAAVSPETRIYSNLSPTMMNYKPDSEIQAVTIDRDTFRIYSERESLWNPLKLEDYNISLAEFEDAAKEKALANGILERSDEQAQKLVREFAGSLPNTSGYTIEFR
jgi:nitrogenase molybdenum-cofactor synthesis protein NifE